MTGKWIVKMSVRGATRITEREYETRAEAEAAAQRWTFSNSLSDYVAKVVPPCTCVVTDVEDYGNGESGPRPHPIYDQDSVETCPVHGRAGDPEAWSLIDAMDRQEAEYRAGLSPEGLARYLAWCEDEETNR